MADQYAIEMLNITKRFPGIIANDNITLQLKKGEIHAICGENGAGKSTTIKMMSGILTPTSGEILIGGKDTSTLIDGKSILSEEELSLFGVLKLQDCCILEDSYIRLRYKVIRSEK